MYAELREMIGSPDVNKTSNVKLDSYLIPALEWLASRLEYLIREDDSLLTLVEDQRKYRLPEDVASVLWLSFNDNRLTPASLPGWDRDGTDFRGSESGTPSEYAIQGRDLWLNPPASSTAIETAPALTIRYLAVPGQVEAGGPLGLGALEQRLAILQAASLWCLSHPSEENQVRYQGYQSWISGEIGAAKRRVQFPDEGYSPHWRPVSERRGTAR